MSDIGITSEGSTLYLWKGRDFRWAFKNLDENGSPVNFPAGTLFFEFQTGPTPTVWNFNISGDTASIKTESVAVDAIPARTKWQLVFLPTGEAAGGDPIDFGKVAVLG